MRRSLLLGLTLGLCVGAGVVILSWIHHGFSAPLLLLGIVLAAVFGGIGVIGIFVRRRTSVE